MNEIQYLKEFTRLYKENSHDKYNREVECHFFMHKENRTKITNSSAQNVYNSSNSSFSTSCVPSINFANRSNLQL